MAANIKGMPNILRNYNKRIKKMENNSLKGLIRAAIIIRRDMDKTPPLIPIDSGNLRASWFVDPRHTYKGPSVRLGFTVAYAWYVHEMVGANFAGSPERITRTKKGRVTAKTKKYFRRPNAGAKFFEAALKRNRKKILSVIKKETSKK